MITTPAAIQITEYQHVVVVMSIVLSLSIAQLLKGIAQLYRTRSRVRLYWLHNTWVALLVVLSLLLWWTFWNYRGLTEWSFVRFVLYLSPIILFYFLASIAIPDPSESVTDLKEYYFSSRRGFFGTFALHGLMAGVAAVAVRGLPVLDASNAFRIALVLLCVLAMRSASERVHATVLVVSCALMLSFIAFQFRLA